MTDVNADEIKMNTQSSSIGERLRQAREAKKLDLSEVAKELRLTKHTIEHIENERWTELHGRAYARGYFTSYVKLLGLPEDEFLAAFNLEYASVEPTLVQEHDTDKKSSWLPSLLLIIILVGSWYGYQQWGISQQQKTQEIVAIEGNEAALLLDNTGDQVTLSEEVTSEHNEVLPASQQDISEVERSVMIEAPSSSADTSNKQTEVLVVEIPEILVDKEVKVSTTPEVVQIIEASAPASENIEVATLEGVLDLQFSGDCWVEVRDANGRSLLNKGMGKGDAIVVMGKTPLAVVIGRASTALVKFNNEVFNFAPFTLSSGVARFTLGAES